MSPRPQFLGKYRGIVTKNDDPYLVGRIRAQVPDVYGPNGESPWALPALPYGGRGLGLFLVPPAKALVWIEFEGGDADKPVWTGCFWAKGEAPVQQGSAAAVPDQKVLKTPTGSITILDTQGQTAIVIKTGKMRIELSDGGIAIDASGNGVTIDARSGVVHVNGQSVSLNDGALEVR